MKVLTKRSSTIATAVAGLLAVTLPNSSHASTVLVQSTGVSDETLFTILTIVAMFQLVVILVIAGVIKSIATNREIWQRRWSQGTTTVLMLVLSFASFPAMAGNEARYDDLLTMDDTGFVALISINLILFFTFLYLTSKLNALMQMMMVNDEGKVPKTFLDKMNQMLTAAVPVEREAEVEMDHEYDGIRELDNNLPPWWLWGFYFTIAFGFAYIINYHFAGTGNLQLKEYEIAMQEAETAKAAFAATQTTTVDENNVEVLADAASLGAGEKTFKLYCAPCHAETGGSVPGGVGPNLTDDYWLHGGSANDIYKTIKYGVPAKGMVSWEAQLSPAKILEVTSFIKSLRGSNPANAKEPQGELWQEAVTPTTTEEITPSDTLTATTAEG